MIAVLMPVLSILWHALASQLLWKNDDLVTTVVATTAVASAAGFATAS